MFRFFCFFFFLATSSASLAWQLEVEKDAMTGKEEKSATVRSPEIHDIGFPYGRVGARLIVRKHPRFGRDVIFYATGGQIPCRSYDPCSVLVKFDDEKPMRFDGANPSDGSSNVVFVRGYDKFVTKASRAKRVMIEVEFWKGGSRHYSFDVSGIPEELLPAKKTK